MGCRLKNRLTAGRCVHPAGEIGERASRNRELSFELAARPGVRSRWKPRQSMIAAITTAMASAIFSGAAGTDVRIQTPIGVATTQPASSRPMERQ